MEQDDVEYNAVFEWKMNNDEIEVFKLAVLYQHEFRKVFGTETDGQTVRRNSLPMRSDPRKSNLFRHCWKMRRETRGLLFEDDYKHYIHANLTIIKIHKGRIEPNSICGDKAWVRYKVWKRHYDRKLSDMGVVAPPPSVSTTDPKIIAQIDKTKKFLFERCDGEPTFDKIKAFIDGGMVRLWVATGKVSQFYLVLSPFVARATDLKRLAEQCSLSVALLLENCTQEVKTYFSHEYQHES
jgi:hypothetical protein